MAMQHGRHDCQFDAAPQHDDVVTMGREAGGLQKGDWVVVKGAACKIIEVEHVKTGKHGPAKAVYVARDAFTGKKCEDSHPADAVVQVPCPRTTKMLVVDVDAREGMLSLLDDETNEMCGDVALPAAAAHHQGALAEQQSELRKKLLEAFAAGKSLRVNVLRVMGRSQVTSAHIDAH
jgi:translation elongation factor P/translation initiation factor 5A